MEAKDNVGLAAHPFGIIRCRPRQRSIEQRLVDPAYVDHDAQIASCGQRMKSAAEPPCCPLVKAGELELLFLEGDACEIVWRWP